VDHGRDPGEVWADTGATAQDAYRLMLRGYVAPGLRELGFRRGASSGAFRCETAAHAAEVRFRKSRGSTSQSVSFWVDMHASDITTEFVYWDWTLAGLAPEVLFLWVVEAGRPVGPVASEVLRVFRSYGWPAIQAALDDPGYPSDPARRCLSQIGGPPDDQAPALAGDGIVPILVTPSVATAD